MELIMEAEQRFLKDNLLMTEDWDPDVKMEDLPGFLDIESKAADDLLQQLPDDLEMGFPDDSLVLEPEVFAALDAAGLSATLQDPDLAMVLQDQTFQFPGQTFQFPEQTSHQSPVQTFQVPDHTVEVEDHCRSDFSSDSSDSGIDFRACRQKFPSDSGDSGIDAFCHIKSEPLSPASSNFSELSSDAVIYQQSPMDHSDVTMDTFPMTCDLTYDVNEVQVKSELEASQQLGTRASLQTVPSLMGKALLQCHTPDTPPQTPPRDPASPSPYVTVVPAPASAPSQGISPAIARKLVLKAPSSDGQGVTKVVRMVPGKGYVLQTKGQPALVGSATPAGGVSTLAKVPIQPKPVPSPAVTPATHTTPAAGKPTMPQGKALVLTAEEFAKLTSQGVLKFQSPAVKQSGHTVVQPVAPPRYETVSCLQTGHVGPVEVEVKAVKRQQRMMKNRESACLSRKKKKEYLHTLEQKLRECAEENHKLKNENGSLKRRINILQVENDKLRKAPTAGQVRKTTTVVLGVLLMLSLNLGPIADILNRSSPGTGLETRFPAAPPSSGLQHHGRTLLASYDYDAEVEDYVPPLTGAPPTAPPPPRTSGAPSTDRLNDLDHVLWQLRQSLNLTSPAREGTLSQSRDLMLARQMEGLAAAAMCPTYFNSTESLRLTNELRGWIKGHEAEKQRAAWALGDQHRGDQGQGEGGQSTATDNPPTRSRKKYYPPRKLKAAMRGDVQGMQYPAREPRDVYEVQVFSSPEQTYSSFLGALQPRNDTFYVVSFKNDHLLLPAIAHNKTTRPRMSLLMPAVGLNDSMQPPEGSVAMMQIDCEVTATKLLYIPKADMPDEATHNATQQPPRPSDAAFDQDALRRGQTAKADVKTHRRGRAKP